MAQVPVKHRWIIPVVLLLAGAGGLGWLQWYHATGEITPRPLFYLIADAQRQLERVPLQLTRVSVSEENEIGRQLAAQYRSSEGRRLTPESQKVADYVASVGQRVAVHVKRKGIRYAFLYLDEPSFVNAFAMPGGQIVIGRGLLQLLESEDELAAILGHEIAHVDERHAIERLQYELKSRKLGLAGLYRLGRPAILLFEAGYTKEKELEADEAGLALAVTAGYSPAGGLDAMKRLAGLERSVSTPAASPAEEVLRVPLQSLREYFRSHPPTRDRIAVMEREIAARGWNAKQPTQPLVVKPTAESSSSTP